MRVSETTNLIKVAIQSNGEDVETPFAEDLGPADGAPGSRRVRLANVPFLHAKPTYEDVIVVEPDAHGRLTWDSGGVPFEEIGTRIAEDSGRWLMIVDYMLTQPAVDATPIFRALDMIAEHADIVLEGCYGPGAHRAGRAYLAVPECLDVDEALAILRDGNLPLALTLVHPTDD